MTQQAQQMTIQERREWLHTWSIQALREEFRAKSLDRGQYASRMVKKDLVEDLLGHYFPGEDVN